ncbi:hypothetical protein LY78DRAFT_241140 [Colletotrichum sublineola]|nr:hypothetical protein LY78DRAFT_241140 [Colletotrichum sublineola]
MYDRHHTGRQKSRCLSHLIIRCSFPSSAVLLTKEPCRCATSRDPTHAAPIDISGGEENLTFLVAARATGSKCLKTARNLRPRLHRWPSIAKDPRSFCSCGWEVHAILPTSTGCAPSMTAVDGLMSSLAHVRLLF